MEQVSVDTALDINIFRPPGRHYASAVHFSSAEDLVEAFSSLLGELVRHARGNDHHAEIDLTITCEGDGIHIGATCLQERPPARRPALTLMLTPLTTAEHRVLSYLSTNFTFAAIAEQCFVSRNTVKTQAISIYRKLGVSSRHDAVVVAQELGLLPAATYGIPSTPDAPSRNGQT